MWNNFFGSKLNSVLLLILIVLMIFALKIMLKDKETYLPILDQNIPTDSTKEQSQTNNETTSTPDSQSDLSPIEKVYLAIHKDGYISECTYGGAKVYMASQNAYDVGGEVYDANGVFIGPTGFQYVEPENYITEGELENCADVFVSKSNIWGKKAVNKYNLK